MIISLKLQKKKAKDEPPDLTSFKEPEFGKLTYLRWYFGAMVLDF